MHISHFGRDNSTTDNMMGEHIEMCCTLLVAFDACPTRPFQLKTPLQNDADSRTDPRVQAQRFEENGPHGRDTAWSVPAETSVMQ